MDIMDIIRKLSGGQDPNAAILDAQGAIPQQQPAPQQAAPPSSAPQGVRTPVTNPQPAGSAPTITQSPPDLANMYVELMKKNQNAQALDSGMTLIAAGLTRNQDTRNALIQQSAGGKGAGGMSLSASDMINFQKAQQEQQNALIRRQALPALMKQYGWSPAQAAALEAGGKLDEVLQNYATANLVQVTDAATGQTHMANGRTGKIITTIGGEKPEETQFVAGPQGQELRSKVSGEKVGASVGLSPTEMKQQFDEFNAVMVSQGKPPMTPAEFFKMKQQPGVTVNTAKTADLPFQPPEKGYEYYRNPDGSIKLDAEGKPSQYRITGAGPAEEEKVRLEKQTKEEAEKTKKEAAAKANQAFAASNVGNAIENAFKHVDKFGAAGFGSKVVRGIPIGGMSWDSLDAAVNTINANVAFEQLRKMREAAATGASGLGQVTEKENQMLASVINDLRAYQDTDQLKRGLARTKAAMELLASNDYKTQADFDIALEKRSTEVLAEQYNKKSGGKITVTPRS